MKPNPHQTPAQASSDSSFPVAGLIWMIAFHLGFLILMVVIYFLLLPELWKMYMEFGVDLPRATKFVMGIGDSLFVWPFLLVVGLVHLTAVGLYAVLAFKNLGIRAKIWMRVSIVLGLIFLIGNALVIGMPCLAIIRGLTGQ